MKELCKCGHDRFMHEFKAHDCLVGGCYCRLYTPEQKQDELSEGWLLTEKIAHWLSDFYYRQDEWEDILRPKKEYDSTKPTRLKKEARALLAKATPLIEAPLKAEITKLTMRVQELEPAFGLVVDEMEKDKARIKELEDEITMLRDRLVRIKSGLKPESKEAK